MPPAHDEHPSHPCTPAATVATKGPVWTMKFNVRGTQLATGGQDGKVVIWDLAVPPGSTAAAATEVERDGSEGASPPVEGDGVDANPNGGADAQESSSSGVETSSTVEGEGSRETLRKTESMSCASTILSDDGAASVGDGSSDLGLSGSSEERGDSWSGSEVSSQQDRFIGVGRQEE